MNITSEKWNQIEEIKGYLVQGSNGEFCYLNEKERIEMIEKVCLISGSGIPLYGRVDYRPGENMSLYANISKAKRILNWVPTINIDRGLKKSIDWFANDTSIV